MNSAKDYYAALGLAKDASEEDIKKKFRELAKKHHPDKEGGSKAKFQEIHEAYEILSDAKTRKNYDDARAGGGMESDLFGTWPPNRGGFQSGGFGYHDIDEILRRSGWPSTQSPLDINLKAKVPLIDVINGGTLKFTYKQESADGSSITVKKEISIPAGIRSGSKLKFNGEGNVRRDNHGERKGNLIVVIEYGDCPYGYRIDESGVIHHDVSVPYYDIVGGATVEVVLLEGGKVRVPVKAGTLRLKGKGMPLSVSGMRADMHVHVVPVFPGVAGEKEKELIEQIRKLHAK